MNCPKWLPAAVLSLGIAGPAAAGPILTDLTSDDYIAFGGLDWAWAGPISSELWFGSNTLYAPELHAGWRLATDLEWAARPDATAFGGKCASQYWNSDFTHCDFGDFVTNIYKPAPALEDHHDIWYVRGGVPPVSEPAVLALLGLGFVATFVASGRKPA